MVSSEAGVSRREVEEACEVARREGAPILTSGAGIRIATHSSQLLDQYRRLRSRYVQQAVNARPVLAAAMRMKAQEDAAVTPRATLWDIAA
jgi:TPP-dependent pyruvate/acetoin dehydrogenase alpha subunit